MTETRAILQLDFDGTLVDGDASTGILSRFVDPAWRDRIEAASRAMRADPASPLLIETMTAGYAALAGNHAAYLDYVRSAHVRRAGLASLVTAAERLGMACHVVSYGFEFYIRDTLVAEDVEDRVTVHCGAEGGNGDGLLYRDPAGRPTLRDFKRGWTEHLRATCDLLVYVGDGLSDIAAATYADIVFARDALLTGMPPHYAGQVLPFDDLYDVARDLEELAVRSG